MNFESLVGTTGLTTYQNKVFIVNNKVITVMDQYRKQTDIPHSFEWVSCITAGDNSLFGIYYNNTYGLFEMDLNTNTFLSVPVDFTPVLFLNLDHSKLELVVIDDQSNQYTCNKQLKVTKNGTILKDHVITTDFMTFNLAKTEKTTYFSANDTITDLKTNTPLPVTINGTILSMQYYLTFLFILYVSDYNQYSVMQYDISNNKVVKTMEGGYISGPPVYTCIYQNYLMISASTNKQIPLNIFEIPLLPPQTSNTYTIKGDYPLFDLPKFQPLFIESPVEVNIPMDKLKKMNDSLVVDTRPAEKNLFLSYVWMFIGILVFIVILFMICFKESIAIHRIALLILVLGTLFIIK
jgi:hypothetical protein